MKAVGLLVGVAFGFLLSWSRATHYDAIRDMLLLDDLYLYFMMGVAMVVAAAGARALRALGTRTFLSDVPVAWTNSRPTRDTLIGSIIFGVGWAVSGACVAPTAAQLGHGQLAGLFTTAGILVGVSVRGAQLRRAEAQAQAATAPPAVTVGM